MFLRTEALEKVKLFDEHFFMYMENFDLNRRIHRAYCLVFGWPLGLLHGVGAALGWLIWLLSPTYRRRFAQNAAQAGYVFGQVRAAVAHAGRMACETPRLWFDPVCLNSATAALELILRVLGIGLSTKW